MSFTDPKVKGSIQVGRAGGFDVIPVGADTFVLSADSVATTGLSWIAPGTVSGGSAFFFYGDGGDGNATLVANTVLASMDNVKRFNNFTQAGFEIENHTDNFFIMIFVRDTWTPGGGIIQGNIGSVGGLGGPGGTPPFSSGEDGGSARNSAFVLARTTVGTGTVNAAGKGGLPGNNASGQGNGAANPGAGPANPLEQVAYAWGTFFVANFGGGGAAGAVPTGGTGGTAGPGLTVGVIQQFKDVFATLCICLDLGTVVSPESGQPWRFTGVGGSGGGSGNSGSATDGGGGGAGGGGAGYFGAGGAGGNGGDGQTNGGATGAGDGGGGGGSGASGSLAFFMGSTVPATVTVTASGGAGGAGGNASVVSGFSGGGGGGGGGGSGGVAIGIAPAGAGYTVTASGGGGGAAGVGGAVAPTAGTAGSAGLAMAIPNV